MLGAAWRQGWDRLVRNRTPLRVGQPANRRDHPRRAADRNVAVRTEGESPVMTTSEASRLSVSPVLNGYPAPTPPNVCAATLTAPSCPIGRKRASGSSIPALGRPPSDRGHRTVPVPFITAPPHRYIPGLSSEPEHDVKADPMTQMVIHPRVTGGSRLRIWAGVFDAPGNDDLSLQWSLDGEITQPATLTELRLAIDNGAGTKRCLRIRRRRTKSDAPRTADCAGRRQRVSQR